MVTPPLHPSTHFRFSFIIILKHLVTIRPRVMQMRTRSVCLLLYVAISNAWIKNCIIHALTRDRLNSENNSINREEKRQNTFLAPPPEATKKTLSHCEP